MSGDTNTYSVGEIMVCAAAAEIKDQDVVFVGMRLPLLAFILAKSTHAPQAVGIFENGVFRDTPVAGPIVTMADLPNQGGAVKLTDLGEVMSLLSKGRVDAGFIGGAQVDRFGQVNTHQVEKDGRLVRLPGSGGAADLACLARRLLIVMPHERHRLVDRVDFVTSPGWGPEAGWREAQGLTRGGPAALITTLGVFRFPQGRAVLEQLHPGVTLDQAAARTGWELVTASRLASTPPPTPEQIEIIRKFDQNRFWTG